MRRLGACALAASVLLASMWPDERPLQLAVAFTPEALATVRALSGLDAPPPQPTNRHADDPATTALGRLLFFDRRLSHDGTLSCASCHDPKQGWSDGRAVAEGLTQGRRNTPSLWNTAHGKWWFWDGRTDSLWAQALGPLESEAEMGTSRLAVWRLLVLDAELGRRYATSFGPLPVLTGELPEHAAPAGNAARTRAWQALPRPTRAAIDRVFSNVGKAIEAFERTIVSTETPFDRFVRGLDTGDQALVDALPAAAQRGLALFVGRGQCALCHHGPTFTDGEFHNLGLPLRAADIDVGRHAGVAAVQAGAFRGVGTFSDDRDEAANRRLVFVTQKLSNMGEFKTPGLRNVARTAPYMHDGRFETLADVIGFYGDLPGTAVVGHREESLLPHRWSAGEVADLVAFLESLTDA